MAGRSFSADLELPGALQRLRFLFRLTLERAIKLLRRDDAHFDQDFSQPSLTSLRGEAQLSFQPAVEVWQRQRAVVNQIPADKANDPAC